MAPRKQTWAQAKAAGVHKQGLPGSAFARITHDNYRFKNNLVGAARCEEAERKALEVGDVEKGKKQVREQKETKMDVPAKPKPAKDSIPAIPFVKKKGRAVAKAGRQPIGVTKTSKTKPVKRARSTRKDSFLESDEEDKSPMTKRRSRRSRIIAAAAADDDDESTPVTESWRPYGGENCVSPETPTVYLGIGRIPEFRLNAFKAALYERLEEGYGIINKPEIATEKSDEGGEVFVDIGARFGYEEIAKQIATDLDGQVLIGRKLRVSFAEAW